jgi:choice-of-anchor B domain-containing protein
MLKFCTLLFLIGISFLSNAQNLNLLSSIDYNQLHDTELNDVWGYTASSGEEYVLVGAQKGVSIVDISDPENPNEVYWETGPQSIWRDLKEYNGYAYVTNEEDNGLMIIDMTGLPGGTVPPATYYTGPANDDWQSAHNIWIDENGFAYIFGANRGQGGVIILDVASDPLNPVEVGTFDNWYVHDGYVRGDTMYLAHIYEGLFSIVDISDKANPILLGTRETPSNFAHNVWPNDATTHVFTTDEVSNGFIGAYNIEDVNNIAETDRIQSSPGMEVVPHNVLVNGDFLITSYYADGLVIHDLSDPENLIEVGRYDTYPGTSKSTIGCWGAYPYYPSGVVVATDIENGLFIFDPDYVYGAKLVGKITNELTGDEIQGASITIDGHNQQEFSNTQGDYKTGQLDEGSFDVTYFKYGYEQEIVSTNFVQGDTLEQDVQLTPIPPFYLTITATDFDDIGLLDADVRLKHDGNVLEGTTDGDGNIVFELFYPDDYEIIIGKWGYFTYCDNRFIDENVSSLTYPLVEGYYDDFSFDFGWSSFQSATDGLWERAIPEGTGDINEWANPNLDSEDDCGEFAYVTGNEPTFDDNVSNGTVTLISPILDLSNYNEPMIHYERWFYNFHGPFAPNDTLTVELTNGIESVIIDQQAFDVDDFHKWITKDIKISDYIAPTASMQLFVYTSDFFTTRNIVEAGFDNFFIYEDGELSTQVESDDKLEIYPNPFDQTLTIDGLELGSDFVLADALGKIILSGKADAKVIHLSTGNLNPGVYFLRSNNTVKKVIKK